MWLVEPTSAMRQDDFIRGYERNDPRGAASTLHRRMTTVTAGRKLSEDIARSCGRDWRQFMLWEQNICLLLARAYSLELGYLWLKFFKPDRIPSTNLVAVNHTQASDVAGRIDGLVDCATDIMAELERGRLRVKSGFLFSTCQDPLHVKCGAAEGGPCNELTTKVYQLMKAFQGGRDLTATPDAQKELAQALQTEMQKEFPQFEWSVLVSGYFFGDKWESPQPMRGPPSLEMMWIQRHGKVRQSTGRKVSTSKEGSELCIKQVRSAKGTSRPGVSNTGSFTVRQTGAVVWSFGRKRRIWRMVRATTTNVRRR